MENIAIILVVLSIATVLSVIANRLLVPYPILLVLVGLCLGFIPGLPRVRLAPDTVFLVFLPPILYAAAWYTSWREFKANLRPISLLAVGLVLTTTTAVAVVAHELVAGMSWAAAFVLGAIVSPPDAVAATAITKRLNVPKRVTTILEGESLVNDATGLVAYKFAVAAVVSGAFSLWDAGMQFVVVATGGVAVGLAGGVALSLVHRRFHNSPAVETTLTLLAPFSMYLLAESIHVSGVLAVVTTGLYLTNRSAELFSPAARLQAYSVWDIFVFLLNGFIFVIIGLQLPDVLNGASSEPLGALLLDTAIICLTVILIRIAWVFPAAYIPRWILKEPRLEWKFPALVAWAGMRGIVTLAAALALPIVMTDGSPFPKRDFIIFASFAVILSTLVIQGLSLPFIIRWLGFDEENTEQLEELYARRKAAEAAISHIEELAASGTITADVVNRLRTKYDDRLAQLTSSPFMPFKPTGKHLTFQQLQHAVLTRERQTAIELRKQGDISDEVLRRIEHELDLEESRLLGKND